MAGGQTSVRAQMNVAEVTGGHHMSADAQMDIVEAISERQRSNRHGGDIKQGLGPEYTDERRCSNEHGGVNGEHWGLNRLSR